MSCWKANYFAFFKVSDANRRSHNYFMVIKVSRSAPAACFSCSQSYANKLSANRPAPDGAPSVIYLMNIVGNCFDSNWHRSKFHLCVGIAGRETRVMCPLCGKQAFSAMEFNKMQMRCLWNSIQQRSDGGRARDFSQAEKQKHGKNLSDEFELIIQISSVIIASPISMIFHSFWSRSRYMN